MDRRQQQIHNKLSDLKAPVQKEMLWDAIKSDPRFPTKSKKRRGLGWLFFGFGLVVLLGVMGYYADLFSTDQLAVITQHDDASNKATVEKKELITTLLEKEPTIESPTTIKEDAIIISREKTDELHSNNRSSKLKTHGLSRKVTTLDEKEEAIISSRTENPSSITKLPIVTNPIENTPLLTNNLIDITALKSSLPSFLTFQRMIKLQLEPNFYPIVHPEKSKWSIAGSIGMGRHNHTFEIIDSFESNERLTRTDNTKTLESYVVSADLERLVYKNWKLSIGGQFVTHYEKFTYDDSQIEYIRNGDNDTHYFSGLSTSTSYNYFHRFRSLDLSVGLGQIFQGQKWNWSYEGGVLLNTWFNVKGNILYRGQETSINYDQTYLTKLKPRWFGNVSVARSINSDQEIFAKMQAESYHALSGNNKASYVHKIRPIYISIGYRFRF